MSRPCPSNAPRKLPVLRPRPSRTPRVRCPRLPRWPVRDAGIPSGRHPSCPRARATTTSCHRSSETRRRPPCRPPTRPTTAKPTRSADKKLRPASDAPQAAPAEGAPRRVQQLSAFTGIRRVPTPVNEPVKSYAPGSPERAELKARLTRMASEKVDIPIMIGGREIRSGKTAQAVMPHNHKHVLADWHRASAAHVTQAIDAARATRAEWANWAWEDRAAVFLKAAELLATTWRSTLNAATMLGQSKTVFQAEIDSACGLIDFYRFNPAYAQELYDEQPMSNNMMWNQLDYRPLEGFVYAVTPFNFTSIGGNLPTAPALMGNTVIWKPASSP